MNDDEERDITPQIAGAPPEQLPPHEVAQIERVLGRKRLVAHDALAARYRQEVSDPYVAIAQVAMDVHDLKRPMSLAVKAAYALLAGALGGAIYVGTAIWGVSERNTAFDYRIRSADERSERVERSCSERLERLERALFRPAYPVAVDKDPHP